MTKLFIQSIQYQVQTGKICYKCFTYNRHPNIQLFIAILLLTHEYIQNLNRIRQKYTNFCNTTQTVYNENSFVDCIMSVSLKVSYKTSAVSLTVSLKM